MKPGDQGQGGADGQQSTDGWMETTATVISCRYQFARLNTLTMGVQTGRKFRIAFDYRAHGQMYSGEFQSPTAMPQGECVAVRYNPLKPEQNSLANSSTSASSGLIAIGVAGSVLLSLIWFGALRSCN